MCRKAQVTVMNSHEGSGRMSLTTESKGNKPQKTHTKQNQPKTNHRNQADQAHVRSSLKKQKAQIRRPNTEVKRGDEFLLSCSQKRTSRTKLHSACWLAGIPPEMQCASVCISKTESKSEVQIKFFLGHSELGAAQLVSKNACAP